jgi:hypothetical protein
LSVRGLAPVPPAGNILVFAANVVLAVGSLVATLLLVGGAWAGRSGTRA